MVVNYRLNEIESKWKLRWESDQTYKVSDDDKKTKFYILDMFPYPSGAGLHVGHPLGYIASDIYSRYKRQKGFNVLHPMGWDAFGLPTEQYAILKGIHPAKTTKENSLRYKEQMKSLGFSFDWSREICTSESSYYKWTQWIFTKLFDHYYDLSKDKAIPIAELVSVLEKEGNLNISAATSYEKRFNATEWKAFNTKEKVEILMEYRLAYRKVGYVNWCEKLGTVLANDQVKDGVSERGGYPVEQKAMTQWYLRITAYAERLINDLEALEWSDSLKAIQNNWIGRSEGASVTFNISGSQSIIEVYTTRPDTIYGATYMVLAPEHPLVDQLTTEAQKEKVATYIKYVKSKTELDRMAEKEVTGEFIGAYAINPFTNEEVPIWIGEYVLVDYGTGAIMAVPSDDDRDKAFATKFGLKIIDVVDKTNYPGATLSDKVGIIINSGFMNGMEVPEAIKAASKKIEDMGIGQTKINYRLRDANFSRQRYWGEPFPVKYYEDGTVGTYDLNELPLVLPEIDDFKAGGSGKPPLERVDGWQNPGLGFTRDLDVMPAVAGSSWYYLRFMDPDNEQEFVGQDKVNYWQDVDLYIGGSEHAVAHLMYARFWHKFLFDKELVPTNEPFKKLVNQGMIQGGIEYICLMKEKVNGKAKFVSAELADDLDVKSYVKIPIHINFVSDYGSTKSYIDTAGIAQFVEWSPDYADAIFECSNGILENGEFKASNGSDTNAHLTTVSEIGKMSKSKFNVINPDDVIKKYGTDCFRMYEMFLGPIQQSKPWDTKGIDGVSKFLKKYFLLIVNEDGTLKITDEKATKDELTVLHKTIKKVTKDIESLSFNTAVSSFMICVNDLKKLGCTKKEILEPLTILLAPFAPFITEEIWEALGHKESIHLVTFPTHDESYLTVDSILYPICINGKKRSEITLDTSMSQEDIQSTVLALDNLKKYIGDKEIKKVIVVPKRMVNIVV